MAIQISGCTVIDNSRNLTNIGSASATSLGGNWIATQAEAEAGTDNTQVMTPLRVSQAISALSGGGMVDSDINWSTCNVGCAVRGGGNVIRKTGGIIWIMAPRGTEVGQPAQCNCTNHCGGNQTFYQPQRSTVAGAGSYKTSGLDMVEQFTGRTGWFVPSLATMQTAYSCRAYWDSYYLCCLFTSSWGSPCCYCHAACIFNFNTGTTWPQCQFCLCNTNACFYNTGIRRMRVVCY